MRNLCSGHILMLKNTSCDIIKQRGEQGATNIAATHKEKKSMQIKGASWRTSAAAEQIHKAEDDYCSTVSQSLHNYYLLARNQTRMVIHV